MVEIIIVNFVGNFMKLFIKREMGMKMSVTLRVSVDEMQAAATRCDALVRKIAECCQECISLNAQLQGVWEGEAARQFDQFVVATASPILDRCSEMCGDTARGIRHTCDQFVQADNSLSGVFRG